jgi:hypothetical protein
MSDFIRLNVRPEVQTYLRSCEYVLALAAAAQNQPFSKDELQLVTYYTAEMDKMVGRVGPHPSGEAPYGSTTL